jgi:hypothetical protein
METTTHHSPQVRELAIAAPADFVPLHLETRPSVETACAAYFLHRRPQTMRHWASSGLGPIQPIRCNGRLMWPTARLRELCGVAK